MANSIAKLAQEARSYFTFTGENNPTMRDNIWVRKDGSPKYIEDMLFAAHRYGDLFPDDYVYQYVVDALYLLAGASEDAVANDLYDLSEEIEPDIYTPDLTAWLSSHTDRLARADEALREFDLDSILTAAEYGQREERQEVFNLVLQALEQELEDREEESEE